MGGSMRLRNKKTGGIVEYDCFYFHKVNSNGHEDFEPNTKTLTELNEDWEDYEGPKQWYGLNAIRDDGFEPLEYEGFEDLYKHAKELGIGFETREQAEKAVEKLKAITRLNKCGFKFEGYADRDRANGGDIVIYAHVDIPNNNLLEEAQPAMLKDLDLLFSGGEE